MKSSGCRRGQRGAPGGVGGVSEQYFKPVFQKIPADLEVAEGQMARFDSVVSGRPIPDMLWFRDGTQVRVPSSGCFQLPLRTPPLRMLPWDVLCYVYSVDSLVLGWCYRRLLTLVGNGWILLC